MNTMIIRIDSPTLAVRKDNGYSGTVTIPSDAVLTVPELDEKTEALVPVRWQDEILLMFAQDLRSRGTIVDGGEIADAAL